jgi:hypothetical protein
MLIIVNQNEGWVEVVKSEVSLNKFFREHKKANPDFDIDEIEVYQGDIKRVELEDYYKVRK